MSEKSRQEWEKKLLRQSKRSLLHIVFSRTVIIAVLLLLNVFLLFSFLFELFEGITLVYGGLTAATVIMLIVILNSDDDPPFKLSWCVVIAVLPLFGMILYLVVRLDIGSRIYRKLLQNSICSSLPYIPNPEGIINTLQQEDPDTAGVARYLNKYANAPVCGNTAVRYFPLGEDKFEEMLRQMERAEQFIFLEYFIIYPGLMWGRILDILSRKAKEGVEVRVLYDGMNAMTNLPADYPAQLEKLGIRCKMFSPVRPFVSTHYNNRDHRKILVVDGHTAFTGGVNLQDRYINQEQVFGHWKDTAVMVQGEAARGFTMMFLQMWNATERQPVFEPYLQSRSFPPAPGYVIPYGEDPTQRERVAKNVYLTILSQTRNYVYIMTPYLILDTEMSGALQFAARRGVDVRIVLPHIPDKRTAFALAKSHYGELSRAGVKIYEYEPGFVHSKVFVSDDKRGVVGTINLDYRSLYHHFECAAYLFRCDCLSDMEADFEKTLEDCRRVTVEMLKNRPLGQKLWGWLMKVIAPLF